MGDLFKNSFEYKVIYVFTINDEAHMGLVKIGDATLYTDKTADNLPPNCSDLNQSALKRIKAYTNTAGYTPKLLYTELAIRQANGKIVAFRDTAVHDVLKNSNFDNVKIGESTGREWFRIDVEIAKKAIEAVKKNYSNLSNSGTIKPKNIIFRPEQEECIDKVLNYFKDHNKFLINAKMRFGKTLVTLEIVKRSQFKKTIILTHRPVVDDGWYDEFTKVFAGTGYIYGSKAKGYKLDELMAKGESFIYFASIQDLRGSSKAGGRYDKNDAVFRTVWDCVIVDEAHEGTTTSLGEKTVSEVVKEKKKKTKFLALSGTPFNIMSDYDDASTYRWDYIMEQQAKAEWDKYYFGDHNPYDVLPFMNFRLYSLQNILKTDPSVVKDKSFNFTEFFRTWTSDVKIDGTPMPATAKKGDFVHEADVLAFLNLMTRDDKQNYYPYTNVKFRALFKHSLWLVPGVKEAKALKKLMLAHPVFGSNVFNIVNVAGDEETADPLAAVRKAIENSDEGYTITLTCGKLTTGVTVKEWTAVLMLAGSSTVSLAKYLQTIFRVQSPGTMNGRVKENAYVFEFAPDRTLQVIAKIANQKPGIGKSKLGTAAEVGKLLNYTSIISVSGSEMVSYSANKLLEEVKKIYSERVVQNGFDDNSLYNDELLRMGAVDINQFKKLQKIIGRTEAMSRTNAINVNAQGMDDEERENLEKKKRTKQPLTPEEIKRLEALKEIKKTRETAISILRGISIRMPLLIYGANIPYDEEITLDKFIDLIDDVSWKEFMPNGVTKQVFRKFQKYYDPEIFIAAGRKIRTVAREADYLEPTERVKKIAGLFSHFKNPDKETVLTPWRVVNMHMGDCIGGWNFWNENFTETIDKPRFVQQDEVTENVFDSASSKILEINSKTGLYPLYVTYSLYRDRCKNYDANSLTDDVKRKLWRQTVTDNVFVICKTPMAKRITIRTICGYSNINYNVNYCKNIVNKLINKPDKLCREIINSTYWGKDFKKMVFDAVVGNPPYQEETIKRHSASNGQASRKNIFHYFQLAADKISSGAISLIYPGARWIHRSGKGMQEFGMYQINDIKLAKVDFYPDSQDIFKDVAIADGISIVYKNINKTQPGFTYIYHKNGTKTEIKMKNPGEELMPLNPQDNSIVTKVASFVKDNGFGYVHDRVLPRSLFGIESNYVEKNPASVRLFTSNGDVDFDNELKLFANDKAGKAGRSTWFVINKNIIHSGQEYISDWKVVVSSANAGGQKRANQIEVLDNHSVFGRSRVAIGSFKTKDEALNYFNYSKTNLIRFMYLMTDESLTSLAKTVPDIMDYTSENNMIDFSQDLNIQLYRLVGLTDEEVKYVEAVINSKDKISN